MKSIRRPNAMLIELIIVILFFALSASIILQLFVAAHNRGEQNGVDSAAMLILEDFAERFAVSREPLDAFLQTDGWVREGEAFAKEITPDGTGTITLLITGETQTAAAGTLDALTLTAMDGDRTAVSLPVGRYLPGEGTP